MAGPAEKLCMAGGLGMNALLISALEKSKQVFVQPAAGNAGTALGAVFYAWNNVFGQKKRAPLNDLCLGPSYSAEEVKQVLENCKLRFHYLMTAEELLDQSRPARIPSPGPPRCFPKERRFRVTRGPRGSRPITISMHQMMDRSRSLVAWY